MSYQQQICQSISEAQSQSHGDLVLFAGAGLSRRHLQLPTWYELLEDILSDISSPYPLSFYMQRTGNLINAAREIALSVHTWAGVMAGKISQLTYMRSRWVISTF